MRHVLAVLIFLAVLVWTRAPATTILVTAGDQMPGGTCSLGQAVEAANTNLPVGSCPPGTAGEDIIRFDPAISLITFSQSLAGTVDALRVTEDLVIDGSDAGGVLLQRSVALGDSTPFRLIRVLNPAQAASQGPSLRLVSMRLANGLTTGFSGENSDGGCLLVRGNLSMQNVTFTGCRAIGETSRGGAVAQIGNGYPDIPTLAVVGSTFDSNETYAGDGAGLYTESPNVDITDSVFRDNLAGNGGILGQGGGLYIGGTDTSDVGKRIERSTFSGNRAMQGGGGLLVTAPALLRNITVSDNSTSTGNGGGILLFGGETNGLPGHPADATIENSTIVGNSAGDGAGTTGGAFAGGIYIDSPSTQAGALPLQLDSVLLADNTARYNDAITPRDLGAQFQITAAGAHNLSRALGTGGSNYKVGFPANAIPLSCDPLLAPLASNGGPTRTRALLAGSCAIDAGSNPDNLATDQRGAGFPRVLGTTADIGAFEATSDVVFGNGFEM